eukprot:scaffold7596_cov113-Isochrysis_galbana.AAC.2
MPRRRVDAAASRIARAGSWGRAPTHSKHPRASWPAGSIGDSRPSTVAQREGSDDQRKRRRRAAPMGSLRG